MVAVSRWSSPRFGEAVLVWTAYGRDIFPQRDDSAVIARFGAETASELLPELGQLLDEFYKSDAKYRASNLMEMGQMAIEDFKTKYPDVRDDVLNALAWCYTFDFK